jgi:hypothetical protein
LELILIGTLGVRELRNELRKELKRGFRVLERG